MPSFRNPDDRRRSQSSCYHHKKLAQTIKNEIRLTFLTEFFSHFISPPFVGSLKNKDKAEAVLTKLFGSTSRARILTLQA
jgi:hypothetical protein